MRTFGTGELARRRAPAALAAALLVALALAGSSAATSSIANATEGKSVRPSGEVSWQASSAYAAAKGIPLKDAARDLAILDGLPALADIVRDSVPPSRLGGVFISQSSPPVLVVRLTDGEVPETLVPLIDDELTVRMNATMSLEDRIRLVNANTSDWRTSIDGLDGVFVSDSTDVITLRVADPSADPLVAKFGPRAAARRLAGGEALELDGLPVAVESAAPGGDDNKGGRDLTSCTSAFAVKVSGTPALLTAGHCPLPQAWFHFDGTGNYSTTYVGKVYNTYADIQWIRPTEGPDVKPFYFGASTSAPGVPQENNVTNTEGDWVCHRGKSTGYSCGAIQSIHYKPTYAGACPGGECESRFVLATGSGLESTGGDSGGPWFRGLGLDEPVGVHKGSDGDHDLWYSKLGNLPSGVSIWVNPDA